MKFQCADETRPDYIHWYVLWACKWLPNHAVTSLSPSLHRRRAGSIQQWDPLCSRLALRKDQWGPAHTGLFTINLDQVMCKQGHEREQKSLPGGLALTRASDRSCQVSKWGHMVSQMWCNNMPNACQKEHETSRCDEFSLQCSALIRHRGFMHDWPSTKTLWLETKVGIRLQQRGRLLMRISPYHSFFLSNV